MQQYQLILRYNALPDAEKLRLTREAQDEWDATMEATHKHVPGERKIFIGRRVLELFGEKLRQAELDRTGAP
jgi:hypothetical protein